jgi:ribosomal protein S1
MASMKVGELGRARVKEVRDNGLYLRAGDRHGIITVVELTWDETVRPHPADFAQPGDELDFVVMTVHEGGFSGSLKRLHPTGDPRAHPFLRDGTPIAATVRAIRPFGVLVNLSIGLVARLEPYPDAMHDSLEVGASIRVVVTDVNDNSGTIAARQMMGPR